MNRLPHVAMLLVAVALVAAEKKRKGDAEKIQGKWIVVGTYENGKRDGIIHKHQIFSGEMITHYYQGARIAPDLKVTFKLRPDKKPRELDITVKGRGQEKTVKGIYELSGDSLKICTQAHGKGRPATMETAADDGRVLVVLKRFKSDDKKKP